MKTRSRAILLATLNLIIVLLATGCQNNSYQISPKERSADVVLKQAATAIAKKYDLTPFGTGGGMMDEIKMLALAFQYTKPIDISSGRELLLSTIDTFLETVNKDPTIRPYLKNYPFEPKNIQIRIFLCHPDRSGPSKGEFCAISALDGVLIYRTKNTATGPTTLAHKETYEEALLAMQGSLHPSASAKKASYQENM
jgi:hypothetical protein